MENETKGFGYFFDKSLRTLKSNMFLLVPNLIFYIVMGLIAAAVLVPVFASTATNPYALMNKIESNPFGFLGAYILFLFVIIAISLFVESGNMYMVRNVVKDESNGLSDFMSGLTKYPHKLLGIGLLAFLAIIGIEIIIVILAFMKLPMPLVVILGIAALLFLLFAAIVFQPYDAVMALGDNGPIDTISKTFKFGKSNFLPLFLLVLITIIISLLFQGANSATSGVSMFGGLTPSLNDFKLAPFIIIYVIQLGMGMIINLFSRIFKFHLYHEKSDDFNTNEKETILDDYIAEDFNSNN